MVRKLLMSLLIFIFMTSIGEAANLSNKTQLQDVRYSLGAGTVRIVLDMKNRVDFVESYAENPSRLVVSLKNTWIDVKSMKRDIELNSTAAKRIKVAQFDDSTVRVVIETMANVKIFWLGGGPSGQRLVIDVGNAEFKPAPQDNPPAISPPIEIPPPEVRPPENDTPKINPIKIPPPEENPPFYNGERILPPSKLDTKKVDKKGEKQSSRQDKDKDDKKSDKRDKDKDEDDKKSDKRDKDKDKDDKKSDKRDKDKDRDDKKSDKRDKDDKKKSRDGDGEPVSDIDKDLKALMKLNGKTIVLDAGHGGADAGAIGPTGVTEKSVTLRVALELRDLLENEGAKVIMTRTTDRQVSFKGDKASAIEELQARCEVANKSKADIFISIHADSFTNPNARGTTGYYFTGSEKSKKLADCIRKALCEQLRTPSRGTKSCNFYVVRHTSMPATLIELAFISNREEEELLDSDEGVTRAAHGIFDGIEDYFG